MEQQGGPGGWLDHSVRMVLHPCEKAKDVSITLDTLCTRSYLWGVSNRSITYPGPPLDLISLLETN
jgi:hypothetical protein